MTTNAIRRRVKLKPDLDWSPVRDLVTKFYEAHVASASGQASCRCRLPNFLRADDQMYQCSRCNSFFRPMARTAFHQSDVPLARWIEAADKLERALDDILNELSNSPAEREEIRRVMVSSPNAELWRALASAATKAEDVRLPRIRRAMERAWSASSREWEIA